MEKEQLDHILAAFIRLEHKCKKGSLTADEYWAAIALAREVEAPHFILEYFAGRAVTATE